jgi:poly(A) polymerase
MAREVCRRLRLSGEETGCVSWLVARHHYFMNARRMRRSTLAKLFAHEWFELLAALHRADALASWGVLRDYEFIMARRREMPAEQIRPPALITGRDLIKLGWQPGPLFGRVLEKVRDAQLDGELSTREEALELARELAGEA